MELKSGKKQVTTHQSERFNRTFMELKLGSKNPIIGSYKF